MMITVPRQCQLRYDNISDPRLLRLFENLPRSSSGTATSAWQFLQGLAVRGIAEGRSCPTMSGSTQCA